MFNFIDWDKEKTIEGKFSGQYKDVGQYKQNVFCFKVKKDNKTLSLHTWAYVGLFNLMKGVPFGTKVRITYEGMRKMPDSDRMYKHFELEIIEPPPDE